MLHPGVQAACGLESYVGLVRTFTGNRCQMVVSGVAAGNVRPRKLLEHYASNFVGFRVSFFGLRHKNHVLSALKLCPPISRYSERRGPNGKL
jgi:hypothetical protein